MFKVVVIESERGWGQKIDEIVEFDSAEKAWAYHDHINNQNNLDSAPDIYWRAEEPQRIT